MLNKDFLRQILIEDKKLLKLSEVQWIEVQKFEVLSDTSLLPNFAEDERMMVIFPDRLPNGRLLDRTYFFNVMHTLRADYTKELICVTQNNRHQAS